MSVDPLTALGRRFQMSVKVVPGLGCGLGQKEGSWHLLSILVGVKCTVSILVAWPLAQSHDLQ